MSGILILELPLPPEKLHPNGRTANKYQRARLVREARGTAALLARQKKPSDCPWAKATVKATFYMPRHRDKDGLVGWIKPVLDGLQDAGIIVNDSGFTVLPPEQVTGRAAGRKLILEITP